MRFQTTNPKSKSAQFQLAYTLRNCLLRSDIVFGIILLVSIPSTHTTRVHTPRKISSTSICKYMQLVLVALMSDHLKVHVLPAVQQKTHEN